VTAQKPNGERDVVPRWRSVRRTIQAGEFQLLADPKPLTPQQTGDLDRASEAWSESRATVAASEFVGIALAAGEPDRAADAARSLAEIDGNSLLSGLGRRALEQSPTAGLDHGSDAETGPSTASSDFFQERIARQKARVIADPRNSIAWADLARRYTALGQFDQAERALVVARSLAPLSRYLLRSATRFHVHVGHPDVAFDMLDRCERTTEDPWLMAAYVSVGSMAERPPKSLRRARRMLENDSFRRIERSDLAGELATLELRAGADRKARSLFGLSLEAPTDNSLAQVEWASHRMPSFEVNLGGQLVAFPAEAFARAASERGDWDDAVRHAREWIDDQPFDTTAASLASYACAVGLEDWRLAEEFARLGLRAQPRDPSLLNNLAFALLESGETAEAARQLSLISASDVPRAERVALYATNGLLQFRLGDRVGGRAGYEAAMRLARQLHDSRAEVMARTMLLREELDALEGSEIEAVLGEVLTQATKIRDPGLAGCVARVERLLRDRRAH
jgi:tetratricopeptide (TPR) repeat protein